MSDRRRAALRTRTAPSLVHQAVAKQTAAWHPGAGRTGEAQANERQLGVEYTGAGRTGAERPSLSVATQPNVRRRHRANRGHRGHRANRGHPPVPKGDPYESRPGGATRATPATQAHASFVHRPDRYGRDSARKGRPAVGDHQTRSRDEAFGESSEHLVRAGTTARLHHLHPPRGESRRPVAADRWLARRQTDDTRRSGQLGGATLASGVAAPPDPDRADPDDRALDHPLGDACRARRGPHQNALNQARARLPTRCQR